jgi:hypothetical protein
MRSVQTGEPLQHQRSRDSPVLRRRVGHSGRLLLRRTVHATSVLLRPPRSARATQIPHDGWRSGSEGLAFRFLTP